MNRCQTIKFSTIESKIRIIKYQTLGKTILTLVNKPVGPTLQHWI
jgi:hypothetical protein